MQATLTGLKYIIGIRESYINPETLRISIHEIGHKTHKVNPNPLITILTDTDKFAEAIHNHYIKPPFKRRKEKPNEQETKRERARTTSTN